MDLFQENTNQLNQLCSIHKVKSLYAFGSVITNNFNKNSDIDLLVDFHNVDIEKYADNYYDLKFALEKLLKRGIDLLEDKAINNPYLRATIDKNKKIIYAA